MGLEINNSNLFAKVNNQAEVEQSAEVRTMDIPVLQLVQAENPKPLGEDFFESSSIRASQIRSLKNQYLSQVGTRDWLSRLGEKIGDNEFSLGWGWIERMSHYLYLGTLTNNINYRNGKYLRALNDEFLENDVRDRINSDFRELTLLMEDLSIDEYNEFMKKIRNNGNLSLEQLEITIQEIKNYKYTKGSNRLPIEMNGVILQRSQNNAEALKKVDDYGCVMETIFAVVSLGGILISDSVNEETNAISRLQDCISVRDGEIKVDARTFYIEYEKLTGVKFSVENIDKMEMAIGRYTAAQAVSARMGRIQPYLDDINLDLQRTPTNYNLNTSALNSSDIEPNIMFNCSTNNICPPTDSRAKRLYNFINNPAPSPLLKALYEYFGGRSNPEALIKTDQWINAMIKSNNLQNADSVEKYKFLSGKFLEMVKKIESYAPDYNNLDKYKREADAAIRAVYGENALCERIDTLSTASEVTKAIGEIAIFAACSTVCPQASTIFASSIISAINLAENRTDGYNSTWTDDLIKFGLDFGTTYLFCKAGEGVGTLGQKYHISEFMANITGNTAESECHNIFNSFVDNTNPFTVDTQAGVVREGVLSTGTSDLWERVLKFVKRFRIAA